MIARSLVLFLTMAAAIAFGQDGIYGPVTAHSKAGDRAPGITFTNLLSSPAPSSWTQSNLTGQLTVIAFFPDTSHNPDSITRWNAMVEQFSTKPVQFLWITGENESTLQPFLSQHPIKGWVFLDCCGKTGQSYGLEMPETVFIGSDRKIIAFTLGPPEENMLNAALEGRITTTRPDKSTLKAFIESNRVLLDAEPFRMPRPNDNKPNFPPSYAVHISPSSGDARGNVGADDFRSLQGYSLKEAIQELYNVTPIRISLPDSLDNSKRYDFALVLPQPESREKMNERFQQGIQDYFHLTARRENRLVDVYVVTRAPNTKPPAVRPKSDEGMGSISSLGVEFETTGSGSDEEFVAPRQVSINAIRGITFEGSVEELCHQLESQLDHPVVDETNLEGKYAFQVESTKDAKNDFLARLRDQTGLVITASQRNVETLVLDPR